jgi:hypothetical protein
MRVFSLIAFGLTAATAAGQTTGGNPNSSTTSAPAAAVKPGASSLSPSSLRTEGLNFGDDLTKIYIGDFAHVEFARESTELSMLVSHYMNTFSRICASDLPRDRVEIMTQECAREAWTVNGYGVEQPGSRHCVDYRTVGTGRYADPAVYSLHNQLDASAARTMIGGVFGAMKQGGDPASGVRRMTDVAMYAANDIPRLVQENGCASPALKRLQANLIRFGEGKDPVVIPGGAAAMAAKSLPAEGPHKDQNHQRLIDDLITEQSQAWMMNRYQPGSVRTGATTRDAQGRPREIVAGYGFVSMGKSYSGQVRVTFVEGSPQCLYFADLPDSCRAPSPRIISAYRRNQYAGEPSPDLASRALPAAPTVARPLEIASPAQTRSTARPEPADAIAPPVPAQGNVPAPSPEGERAMSSREEAQKASAAVLAERQAAAKERRCAFLRSNIDRARESAANAPPQRAQRAEAKIERAELSYAQQCNR